MRLARLVSPHEMPIHETRLYNESTCISPSQDCVEHETPGTASDDGEAATLEIGSDDTRLTNGPPFFLLCDHVTFGSWHFSTRV